MAEGPAKECACSRKLGAIRIWRSQVFVIFHLLPLVHQSWGRSLIFDLKIKDPSNFADLFDDLDHTRGSDLINGDLDLKITLQEDHFNSISWDLIWILG